MITVEQLKKISLFNGLPDEQLNILAKAASDNSYDAGQIFLGEEEHTRGLYLLFEGRVKIFKSSMEGREQTLYLFAPGETFCLGNVLKGDFSPANAMALEPSRIIHFSGEILEELGRQEPSLLVNMVIGLSNRLKQSMDIIESLSLKDIPQRLAAFILHAASRDMHSNTLDLCIAHKELAKMLGTTPESLSRAFKKMIRDGLIEQEGRHIKIIDEDALEELAAAY